LIVLIVDDHLNRESGSDRWSCSISQSLRSNRQIKTSISSNIRFTYGSFRSIRDQLLETCGRMCGQQHPP
jgi:hypothetical protein